MLLSFTVGNFRSIYTPQTLDLLADTEDMTLSTNLQDIGHGYKLLKSAVIYGANSSGKSNLIRAMVAMKRILRDNAKLNPDDSIEPYEPFALKTESEQEPTLFEMVITKDEVLYRYGFEYTEETITKEWLYTKSLEATEETCQLYRTSEQAEYRIGNELKSWDNEFAKLHFNRLLLSLINQLKEESVFLNIFKSISEGEVLSGLNTERKERTLLDILNGKAPEMENKLHQVFQKMDLGFKKIVKEETPTSREDPIKKGVLELFVNKIFEGKDSVTEYALLTLHNVYNKEGKIIEERFFNKDEMESDGTKKVIELMSPLLYHLEEGRTIVIDELDAKLHPLLTREIIKMFGEGNPRGAQLIFATHDSNLLSKGLFRADQIWFTEKNNTEETRLFSLLEFEEEERKQLLSKGETLEESYLSGRFGGIPII